ncbi:MAG: aminoacyl-tRNA hydrolase [Cyanobacteria bacterium SIG28]|nr:aminoacyl-tRNA hydrolase [Cyanobacteria bacterium SIG28]
MKLVVGLGNVGNKYTFTRHNVGFMLADSIALNNGLTFRENPRLKCFMANLRNGIDDYLIIKPTTFMNLSGEAVRAVMDYYKIPVNDILIVYDDLSLELGKMRFRPNGSDGGHNGIKSVIQHLGTKDVARLKIGIGPQPNLPSEVFVLQNFTKEELEVLKPVLSNAKDGINCYFKEGMAITQNRYN